jgi:hypothetical protein
MRQILRRGLSHRQSLLTQFGLKSGCHQQQRGRARCCPWPGLVLAFALVLLGLSPAQASPISQALPVAIDSFATAQPLIQLLAPGDVGNTTQSTAVGAGILGGERDIQISMTAGAIPGNRLSTVVGGDLLGIGFEPTVQGTVQVQWDGPDGDPNNLDPVGLGGFDLTQGGTQIEFLIDIFSDDLAANLVFEVFSDAGNASIFTLNLAGAITNQNRLIPFAAFTPSLGAGADFTNVGAITLTITSLTELDLVLDSIGTNGPIPPTPTSVPETRDDDDRSPAPPAAPPGGGSGGAATPQPPEFPTQLPETGEPPPQPWPLIATILVLAAGVAFALRLINSGKPE